MTPCRPILAVAALAMCVWAGVAQQNVEVTFDGAPLTFAQPVLMWDMTFPLLPAQPFLESLGATVNWDATSGELDADLPGVSLQMLRGTSAVLVNGQRQTMEYGLQTLNGVPYLPGPATARLLGFDVTWDPETLTLSIGSAAAAAAETTVSATLLAPPSRAVPAVLTVRNNETGRLREVPLDQQAAIERGRDGQQLMPASVDDLEPGDLLELGLTQQGVAVSVRATYDQELGTIASIQGNQLALQDGRSFPLGEVVAAAGSDGQPLHLLGTVGDAAILRLNPRSDAVWGIFSQRRGSPVPPTTAEPIIAAFTVPGYDGPLAAGGILTLHIIGSAGGQATAILPWYGTELSVPETSPGIYTGSFEIPEGMTIASSRLTGRLALGGAQSATAQSNTEIVVDTAAPLIYNVSPPSAAVVEPVQPQISASFQDSGPAGIDTSSVAIQLDGRDLTSAAQVTTAGFMLTPDELAPGSHRVTLRVSDRAGNTTDENWEFTVRAPGGQLLAVSHDATAPLHPGDALTVTATVTAAGRRASFDIAGVVQDVAMQLTPGTTTYRGTYEVREGDQADNAAVTVHFTDAGGVTHDAVATAPVTLAPVEEQQQAEFGITYPEDGAQVGRRITPAGTGPPEGRVSWVITYRKAILGGEVARGVTTVAADGAWQTDREIDLRMFLIGMADRYTLTAQLLGEGDTVAAERSVAFRATD